MTQNLYDDIEYVRKLVYEFKVNELKKILEFMEVVKYGKKKQLRKRIIGALDSSLRTKRLRKKIIKVYESRTQQPAPHQPSPSRETGVSSIPSMSFEQRQLATIDQGTPSLNSSMKALTTKISYDKIIKFEHLPFFEPIAKLLDISFLSNKHAQHYIGCYALNPRFGNYIKKTWSIARQAYKIQIILKFAQLNPEETTDQRLPYNLTVTVNGEQCKLPTLKIAVTDVLKLYQKDFPIDITRETISKNRLRNEIIINWSEEPHDYVASIYVVEKLTTDKLLVQVKERPLREYQKTKELIKKSMESDIDMGVDSISTTLQDPLSLTRMKLPVRGVHCLHLQCFDAIQFLELNDKNPTWACPLCNKKVKFENIEVDEFFLHILQSPNLSKESENVILLKDGSWSEKKRNFSNSSVSNSSSNKRVLEITLSDSDDDDVNPNSKLNQLQANIEHTVEPSNHSIMNPIHSSENEQKEICVITLD